MTKSRVLFVCTHKSACSHMAEGSLRRLAGDRFEVISAGREATSVRPEAVAAMAELGVGISGQESKTLERYLGEPSTTSSPSATTPTRPARSSSVRSAACTGRFGFLRGQRAARRSGSRC
jgi:hypothetical protein